MVPLKRSRKPRAPRAPWRSDAAAEAGRCLERCPSAEGLVLPYHGYGPSAAGDGDDRAQFHLVEQLAEVSFGINGSHLIGEDFVRTRTVW
jgi:hypothetical protein